MIEKKMEHLHEAIGHPRQHLLHEGPRFWWDIHGKHGEISSDIIIHPVAAY